MSDAHLYERLIYGAIASSIGLKLTDLRLPTVVRLPETDYELFSLLDVVPGDFSFSKVDDKNAPRLSTAYGGLLESQPDSFMLALAKNNHKNPKHWHSPVSEEALAKTPIYSPSPADVADSAGSKLSFTLDSSEVNSREDAHRPSLTFNQNAPNGRFIFRMWIDSVARLPVRAGGWFSQAAFANAHQSKGVGWLTGPSMPTWADLFGDRGALRFVYTGIVAITGIKLELQCFGHDGPTMLDALSNNEPTAVWPYYLNVPGLGQDYRLGHDGSITITTRVPSSETLLFMMEARRVSALLGH